MEEFATGKMPWQVVTLHGLAFGHVVIHLFGFVEILLDPRALVHCVHYYIGEGYFFLTVFFKSCHRELGIW